VAAFLFLYQKRWQLPSRGSFEFSSKFRSNSYRVLIVAKRFGIGLIVFRPRGSVKRRAFFWHQYNVAFWKLILYQFWPCLKQLTWIGVQECTPMRNFRISASGFASSKNCPWKQYSGRGACYQRTARMAKGIISGASRHPKDVPFVREFWWGMYYLGTQPPE